MAPGPSGTTAGSGPQRSPGWSDWARAAPFRVSQPSAGQVSGCRAVSVSEAMEPWAASRHRAGVADGDRSLARRPDRPTRTTCRAAGGPDDTWARAGTAPASTAASGGGGDEDGGQGGPPVGGPQAGTPERAGPRVSMQRRGAAQVAGPDAHPNTVSGLG